jgi:hypothetical protein
MRALKVLSGVAVATGLIFASTVAPASAAGTGCPTGDGWTLLSTLAVIPDLDNGNYADQNGDGLACFKVNKGQTDKFGIGAFTWKDNTNPS